jgi:hypothetical protein
MKIITLKDKIRFRDANAGPIHAVDFSRTGKPYVTVWMKGPVEIPEGIEAESHDNPRFHKDDPDHSWTNDGPDRGRWFNHYHIARDNHLGPSILKYLPLEKNFRRQIETALRSKPWTSKKRTTRN